MAVDIISSNFLLKKGYARLNSSLKPVNLGLRKNVENILVFVSKLIIFSFGFFLSYLNVDRLSFFFTYLGFCPNHCPSLLVLCVYNVHTVM